MLGKEKVTRHVCPRNCYDTCAILAYVRNGRIVNITGDPAHGYTRGKLCAKGYSYLRRVYSPDRIRQPLRQSGRGTGNWHPITWDEALDIICDKMLELKHQYGTTLPICLNKYSGNFGLLNNAIEGLLNRFGPTTQVLGSPCWSAGLDAQHLDFGNNYNSDPENIRQSKLIILWGVNPAWTAVHSLPYIHEARRQGAKVVAIDPIYSETGKKADIYIQVRPGQDGYLALAVAKTIVEMGRENHEFVRQYSHGWDLFKSHLLSLDMGQLLEQCGVRPKVVEYLADLLITHTPAFIWIGFGLQRYTSGGQNVRAIDALGALTGNIGKPGGGAHYANLSIWKLFQFNFHKTEYENRYLNINHFAHEIRRTQDPPVKMLWIANRNLFGQDANSNTLAQLIKDMDLLVCIDEFMTESAKYCDLLLPTTTFFEELDLVPGYWHHWLALNEQAISPLYQSKSDLEIAMLVSRKLNELEPGSCSFAQNASPESFLDAEFDEHAYRLLGIDHWSALRDGPVRVRIPFVAWQDYAFATPSGRYEFYSQKAAQTGLPALPLCRQREQPGHPDHERQNATQITAEKQYAFRLLSPHSQHSINSQFSNLDWIKALKREPAVSINREVATEKQIRTGDMVRLFNAHGEIFMKANITTHIPRDVLVCHQGSTDKPIHINKLLSGELTDMGSLTTGNSGLAIFETFVDIELQSF